MRGKKNANVKSAGATSSSTSTRKPSAKRARSPEPIIPGGSDAAQPKNKRSKQAASGGSTATTQLVATGATAIVQQVNDSQPPPPTFAGNFDLYDMELPFLSKVYLPEGVSIPQYEDLYKTILTYQAKDDKTARIFLASPTDQKSVTSKFICSSIEDPMEDFPFDIKIHSIEHNASLSLPSDKLPSGASASAAPDKSGVSASMSLEDDHCGIQSASGAFKLKRVWTKATAGGAFTELFAGYLTFNVSYSGMDKRKGHGAGQKHKWGFWAVRAKTGNDGMEVGLQPMLPVAVRASANPPTHPVAATVASAAPATSKQVIYITLMLISPPQLISFLGRIARNG
ncbi:hypothetical protein M413DRAFT_150373 [Hebeloma cylindrosporum]|uniref:Uncharacterized protein n=1 Tax=Hebeloma cylindrosporum TaxID=76867 RepID=A0A0C3BY68_HEBCY|nr:hypothetical protein M413DRAFT_150373 [Hebeloma cylindrosporum h7]